MNPIIRILALSSTIALSGWSQAAIITFQAADFVVTPDFSDVTTFNFTIDLVGPLVAGVTYTNPTLNSVVYGVSGQLGSTPSGFPGFNLQRNISGTEFYSQGSSLEFAILVGADLSDGLQASELVNGFTFDGREVDTGRYHPALVELFADGTGTIQNSNNMGGINPVSEELVNVDYGEEYITLLNFDPATLTLSEVPVPAAAWLFGSALLGLVGIRCKQA